MTSQPSWRRYLRFWGPDLRSDVDDELSFHLRMLEEEYRSAGLTEEEARTAARRRFGEFGAVELECIHIGTESEQMIKRREVWSSLMQDMRFGVRQLRRNPLVSAIAVLTLALGIGANTAIFSLVDGILLRPLPYRDADRLVVSSMSLPDYRDFEQRARSFDQSAVWASNIYRTTLGDEPAEIRGGVVSANFFALLSEPLFGRVIGPDDQRTPVAVISYAFWQRSFAGDRSVLGRTLSLNGSPYTMIGVMPRSFEYPDPFFDVWVPLQQAMAATPAQLENRSLRIFRLVAHLKAGVTLDQLETESTAISQELARLYPQTNNGVEYGFVSLTDLIVGGFRTALWTLLAVVGLVLLIACGNVANLLLGLTAARAREIAVRRALGAGKTRLIRQLITESLVLALVGGAFGILLAMWLVRLLPKLTDDLPRLSEVGLDSRVLFFAIVASVTTALLFGLAPALQGSRSDLNEVLKEGGRGGVGMQRGGALRAALVSGEVALAVIVLVGAGLMIQSMMRVVNQDIGFETDDLISANVGLFYFSEPAQRSQMLSQVLERVATVPGVEQVAGGSALPPQTAQRGTGFSVAGRTPDAVEQDGAYWIGITPAYFSTLGTRVIRGREFSHTDGANGAPVAIINQTLARALFGDQDPLGRQIQLTNPDAGPAWRTIVGVVADVRYSGVEDPTVSAIYTPFNQTPFLWSYLMVRSKQPAERLTRPLRQAIGGLDPRMMPARVNQHSDVVGELIATRAFLTWLLAAFALLALTLAAVGIYGVISYNVAQRRREIGVRLALGARPALVVAQVVTRALRLIAIGAAVGLIAAFWLTRLLTSMLYDMRATDPKTYVLGAVVMTAIGFAASGLPALRASHVDPARILRE
jgi:putative ABC transport system permease protein